MLDRRWLFGVIGLAVLAVMATAVGLYVVGTSRSDPGRASGMPTAMPSAGAAPADAPAGAGPTPAASIDVLAERMAKRLKESDGTADEWALLARSYVQMRRYPEAVDAFGKAIARQPGNMSFVDEQAAARKAGGMTAPAK